MALANHLYIQGNLHVQGRLSFGPETPPFTGFWSFNTPVAGTTLTGLTLTINPATTPFPALIYWGDGQTTIAYNNIAVSHTYL